MKLQDKPIKMLFESPLTPLLLVRFFMDFFEQNFEIRYELEGTKNKCNLEGFIQDTHSLV